MVYSATESLHCAEKNSFMRRADTHGKVKLLSRSDSKTTTNSEEVKGIGFQNRNVELTLSTSKSRLEFILQIYVINAPDLPTYELYRTFWKHITNPFFVQPSTTQQNVFLSVSSRWICRTHTADGSTVLSKRLGIVLGKLWSTEGPSGEGKLHNTRTGKRRSRRRKRKWKSHENWSSRVYNEGSKRRQILKQQNPTTCRQSARRLVRQCPVIVSGSSKTSWFLVSCLVRLPVELCNQLYTSVQRAPAASAQEQTSQTDTCRKMTASSSKTPS